MRNASPLRYPGGKWRIAAFFERLITINHLEGCHYVEPYAGGASLALSLLISRRVSGIHLNDLSRPIYTFWESVLTRNHEFVDAVISTPVTPDEWRKQRAVYEEAERADAFSLGFATFFLNRTNHSGILNGGMIGGKHQRGVWKVDARFNRSELARRIERIGALRSSIRLSCEDAVHFLDNHSLPKRSLVYLDPPYYTAGRSLYFNSYKPIDHSAVRDCAKRLDLPWVVSYDDVPQIRELYGDHASVDVRLLHTARSVREGHEVLFFAAGLTVPQSTV